MASMADVRFQRGCMLLHVGTECSTMKFIDWCATNKGKQTLLTLPCTVSGTAMYILQYRNVKEMVINVHAFAFVFEECVAVAKTSRSSHTTLALDLVPHGCSRSPPLRTDVIVFPVVKISLRNFEVQNTFEKNVQGALTVKNRNCFVSDRSNQSSNKTYMQERRSLAKARRSRDHFFALAGFPL